MNKIKFAVPASMFGRAGVVHTATASQRGPKMGPMGEWWPSPALIKKRIVEQGFVLAGKRQK